MNNCRRYCKIQRNKNYHLGVLDRETSIICHVVNKNGKAEYRFDNEYLFDPAKSSQKIEDDIKQSDEAIKENWDFIEKVKEDHDQILTTADGKEVSAHIYDPSGLEGVSCESITEFILNGKLEVHKGNRLKILRKARLIDRKGNILGIIDGGSSNF